jgi:glycosyltransferase involved in cell wall biosynthesis
MTIPGDEIARVPAGDIVLSLVVPVFNEAETVALFSDRVSTVFRDVVGVRLEIIFVNDGSRDDTLARVLALQRQDARVRVIDLSRNFGKEAALSAGLADARGEVIVPIDVDLQDPPELILEMIAKWREGYDVVVGRRVNRDSDTRAKRMSAAWFYRIHNAISDLEIPENVGDFRLMDRAVVQALATMPESRRFMKGLMAWAGFRTTHIDYARPARSAGTGKFSGWRLWNFALEGITSFSTIPLRIWTYVGIIVASVSILYASWITVRTMIFGVDVPGYASLLVAVMLLGGIQLIGIGVLGEYLGRTYLETKRRPVFVIRRTYVADPATVPATPARPVLAETP